MVAQLEHQFRLGRLSVQGLWFFCQVGFLLLHLPLVCGFSIKSYVCYLAEDDEFVECIGSSSGEGYFQQYQWFCNS